MRRLIFLALLLSLSADACDGFRNLITNFNSEYPRDRYGSEEHLRRFWEIHRRFGVINHGGRMILIARDAVLGQQLLNDLAQYSGRHQGVTYVTLGIPGVGYDVTTIASDLMYRLAERWGEDGPNCWNLCLRHSGIAGGANYTDGPDFKHWMESPLAKKIERVEDLRPGDVIAFRARTKDGKVHEAHGAIFISPRMLFTKNGYQYNQPYRVADIDEVYNIAIPQWANSVDAFRITPMREYIANNAYFLPPLVQRTAQELENFERVISPLYVNEAGGSFNIAPYRDYKWREGERLKAVAKAQMGNPSDVAHLSPEQRAVVDVLWKGFFLRLDSIISSGY